MKPSRALRVLYFSMDYGPHDHRFLAALSKTPHKVFFLRLARQARQTEDRPLPIDVEHVSWIGGRNPFHWRDVPRLLPGLRRVLQDVQPDVVHAGPIQTCAFLAALSGFRPILTMSWGFDLMEDADRSFGWRWATRYTLRRSAYFVSDARVTRSRAIALGMRPDRTAVFPWGVDLQRFAPAASRSTPRVQRAAKSSSKARRRSDRRLGGPLVLFCNRSWEPRYGVDVLAKAFVLAANRNGALSLILLGGGSQSSRIRQILLDGGVWDRVQFAGQVSNSVLPRWYRMADVFVSPSHVDGSSVSLMEALACGIPALVSNIPANKEWVREGSNGWLFKDGDANHLADRLIWLSSRRTALAVAGRAARRVAEARADWTRNFPVLLRAYERAVSGT